VVGCLLILGVAARLPGILSVRQGKQQQQEVEGEETQTHKRQVIETQRNK